MACYLRNKDNLTITVPRTEDIDKITFYEIFVKVGSVSWTVKHRYSEFVKLHDKLIMDHCVTKDILPPKKLIGKRDPSFIETRRSGLENYLITVVSFLKETMPRPLALFLDFHKYDVLFLLQEMSFFFLNEGDLILSKSKSYSFNPLQLHAISERLKQPCPPVEIFDRCYDFSHVLDFCCQLVSATVEGCWETVGTSDIVPNRCPFEFSALKDLQDLSLRKVAVGMIHQAGSLRQGLTRLLVTECSLQSPADALLCDAVHKQCDHDTDPQDKQWLKLIEADFSQNSIQQLDSSVQLMPNLKHLFVNENQLTNVGDLTGLPNLTHLHLSANRISNVDNLHRCLASNIVHLDLSQNHICSLRGFSALGSLQGLDLGSNIVTDVSEVQHIQSLERLDYLVLTGNPVATVVDYRIKVLQHFGRRAASICLDNEKPSQKELDTVAVVLALRVVKEGKAPVFSRTVEPTYPNSPQ